MTFHRRRYVNWNVLTTKLRFQKWKELFFANDIVKIVRMLISDGINHRKLQAIIVGELKKAGLKHRLKKIILKNVKVSRRAIIVLREFFFSLKLLLCEF